MTHLVFFVVCVLVAALTALFFPAWKVPLGLVLVIVALIVAWRTRPR